MVFLKSGFCCAAGISLAFASSAFSQTPPSNNPTYQQDTPLYSAQSDAGKDVVYDSYWINENGWRIHCSQDEFCYMQFGWRAATNYSHSKTVSPLQFDPDKRTEHSFAMGIKGGSQRVTFSFPFFEYEGRTYTSNWQDYEGKDRPSGKISYFVDDKLVTSRPFKNKIPMSFSMYTDWEPDTKPLMEKLVGTLYHNDPKELIAIIYFDESPVIGVKLDVRGFKDAYDEMLKERNARRELAQSKSATFMSWPSVGG